MVNELLDKIKNWWKSLKYWRKGAVVVVVCIVATFAILWVSTQIVHYEGSASKSEYNYDLNSLFVNFNGKSKGNLVADTQINRTIDSHGQENEDFKRYFQRDLNTLSLKIEGVQSMKLDYWYIISNSCSVSIEYSANLSQKEKNNLLDTLRTKLDSKWYVNRTTYNVRYSINT